MYIITSVTAERQTAELSSLFKQAGIRYAFELRRTELGERFDLLVFNKEDVVKARRLIKNYIPGRRNNPFGKDEPIVPKRTLGKVKPKIFHRPRPLVLFLTFLCVAIFLVHEVSQRQIVANEERARVDILVFTPVMQWGLLDFPQAFEQVVEFQNSFPPALVPNANGLTEAQRKLFEEMQNTPFWGGLYSLALAKLTGVSNYPHMGNLFEKISQGQVWRFFTPSLLHESVIHLFFNMFWLLSLGSLVERRIGSGRLVVLIAAIMVVSNTAQYIVSGPLFLGFSGVACGFAGFIFARRQVARWENYAIEPGFFWLFFCYVILLAIAQVMLFCLELFGVHLWPLRIANTAHIVGGLVGYALGRLYLFRWQVRA